MTQRATGVPAPGLLSGIRVVSLAEQYPGPYCTMLLSDLGADVILLERPGRGDPARLLESFFGALNRGKRSLTLDLKRERGREIAWQLLETADVLVEGFRPGVMARLGLEPEHVLRRLPRLVYCSISGYGQDGPYRTRAGHDLSYQALAGLLAGALQREPDAARSPVAIGDLSSAMFAAFGIVAALLHREREGAGQYLDVSMTDGLVSWMGTALEPVLNGAAGGAAVAGGEPAYGLYRCAGGGLLSLSIAHEDHFWRNLCQALDLADVAGLDGLERRQRRAELRALLAGRIERETRDHWVERLERADVPVGPVLSLAEVAADPHLRARGMFVPSGAPGASGASGAPDEPGDGERWHVANPLRFARTPARAPTPAPALGEQTDAILYELGLDASEIDALRRDGTV